MTGTVPATKSGARAITCPACGGTIAVKAAGYSVSVGCQHCGALLDVANPDVTVIDQYERAVSQLPIPLGRRGSLQGTEWEAIGALARSDGDVDWTETLLFNPYAGYRWLVLSEGDWTFGTMVQDRPAGQGESVTWRGQDWERDYEPASTETTQVVGEFYWRVRQGDRVEATTYSRGDQMLSAEWSEDEFNWTHLVALSGYEVERAFGLGGNGGGQRAAFGRRSVEGLTGAAQQDETESDYGPGKVGTLRELGEAFAQAEGMAWADLPKMFVMAFGTLLASMLVMIIMGTSSNRISQQVSVPVDGREVTVNVGRITINRPWQAVTLDATSGNYDNKWVDIDYTLVDRATQRGYTAYGVVEHYSGRDSDGPWSEGSYAQTTKISGVPRGTYDVVADLSAHTWQGASRSYSSYSSGSNWAGGDAITVILYASAGGVMWSNLWLELAVLLGVPILILWWRNRSDD